MSRLITQTVEDLPQVLLVSQPGWFRDQLSAFWKRHGFEPVVIDFSQVKSKNKDFWSQNWYKTTVIIDFIQKEIPSAQDLTRTLEYVMAMDNIYWVVLTPSLLGSVSKSALHKNQKAFEWHHRSQQVEKVMANINESVSDPCIVVGENIVPVDSSAWWPSIFSFSRLDEDCLVDPKQDWSLLQAEEFITYLQTFLLAPHSSGKYLMTGAKVKSTDIINEINRQYQRYHHRSLRIIEHPLPLLSNIWGEYKTNIVKTQIPSVVEETVRNLPGAKPIEVKKEVVAKKVLIPKPHQPVIKSAQKPEYSFNKKIDVSIKNSDSLPIVSSNKATRLQQEKSLESTPVVSASISQEDQVKKKLQDLFSTYRVDQKTSHLTDTARKTKTVKYKNKNRTKAFYVGLSFVFTGLIILLAAVFFVSSQKVLENTLFVQVDSSFLERDKSRVVLANNILNTQLSFYQLFLPAPFIDNAAALQDVSNGLLESTDQFEILEQLQVAQFLQLMGSSYTLPEIDKSNSIQDIYENISRVVSRLEGFLSDEKKPQKREALSSIMEELEIYREQLVTYQQVEPLLPSLFAQESKRTYAIVFQNDQELRATGGFIQAVALVTIDQGIIVDTQVMSSYQIDNQFLGEITPPPDLKKFLGEEKLYFRDSNWSPDFPTAAKQMAWFLEQKTNKDIDGVVGMNLQTLEKVLTAIGPLDLPQYNELLTGKNISERMEFHSEVNLVENDQLNDYSTVVLDSLFKKITDLNPDQVPALLSALDDSIESKQLLISSFHSGESSTLDSLGWSGALITPNCPSRLSQFSCQVDTLAVIDSNVGVNKANYHTDRREKHDINLTEDKVLHHHQVIYENNSKSNSWPKGSYSSYLRFLLPAGSEVTQINVNGKSVPESDLFAAPLDTEDPNEFRIVGVKSITPIQSSSTIDIKYELPREKDPESSHFSYSFFYQKQPGLSLPLEGLTVTYPPLYEPSLISPQASVSNQTITYSDLEDTHFFAGISF